ncbi:MAG: aminotransferase class III-fold pyridoxal phosphate-dependent enzyme, partial [Magnetococcales bacterium]|nr:aminotransferase class III-fold pyridoxal phosphate-dependent enzyme [Magnetococcales bacterium]
MSHIFGDLAAMEARYCSWGDTVHYNDPIRMFEECQDAFLFDSHGNRYLDFQMAYSAVNFGYRNGFFLDAILDQLDRLPQIASEYVTREKILLCARICRSVEERWGIPGRVHFNVGGSQAIEDSLKLIAANCGRRKVFAFEGSYHGRTLGASSISSSFRYRSRYGDFGDRACFIPFPYCFRCPYGKDIQDCDLYCANQFARLFESEFQGLKDMRDGRTEFVAFYAEAIQGTGGYVIPPKGYFPKLKRILDEHGILFVLDDIQMGFFRTGTLWSIEHFGIEPDVLIFGKSLTNGLNPLSGIWAREKLISPDRFPPGSTHSSFASNPIGVRLGLATFDWIDKQDLKGFLTWLESHDGV